ncbi:radial spoke head protein 3 homolog [Artibeus jamaicensis]|uniref:radial spoke head protein 3 homolog n=1 Tax=Artibeus jamaicensis TaxID=9417 RepID=UPI00235AB1BF|nr:radial spoke head protein 3 homolog [Artibeus jamaicensis]
MAPAPAPESHVQKCNWSEPWVAPTSKSGKFPSRRLPLLLPILAPRNPCPWHKGNLSGCHDDLAPTRVEAEFHRKLSASTADVASILTDRASRTMSTYTYTFTSRPRVLPCQRRRYRDSLVQPAEQPMPYANIMYDRRVIRGNTYAAYQEPPRGQISDLDMQKHHRTQRRALAKKRAQEQLRPWTPEPVEGRKHVDVQTELYLEEIADRVIEVDMECQTDAFLDRPPTPLFVPAKTGRDVATEILEGELFDFDLEVRPMLEVLIGKTIEQSLLEVMEEEELANLRVSQNVYEELRNVELAEVQRLEEQERRHRQEKERRKQQQWEVVQKHKQTAEKIAARAFAQRYLSDLLPSVFGSLRDGGYFFDPIERDVELGFLPWLMKEVDKTVEHSIVGRTVLDMLIREVVERRLTMYDRKGNKHQSLKPESRPSGPAARRNPPMGHEFQDQRPLPSPDFVRRTERVSSQERMLREEDNEPVELRNSSRGEAWEA